jgi:hypothetical protein
MRIAAALTSSDARRETVTSSEGATGRAPRRTWARHAEALPARHAPHVRRRAAPRRAWRWGQGGAGRGARTRAEKVEGKEGDGGDHHERKLKRKKAMAVIIMHGPRSSQYSRTLEWSSPRFLSMAARKRGRRGGRGVWRQDDAHWAEQPGTFRRPLLPLFGADGRQDDPFHSCDPLAAEGAG